MTHKLAAEKAKAADKRGAMMALKQKKMLTTELESLGNARLTLEQQIMSLESMQSQQIAVQALATGVAAQKQMNKTMNDDELLEELNMLEAEQFDQKLDAGPAAATVP